jgi:hypothetical protein
MADGWHDDDGKAVRHVIMVLLFQAHCV